MVDIFYSKEKINKAGNVLAEFSNDFSKDEATSMLETFRSMHIKPMVTFRINLNRKLKQLSLEEKSLLSQRLKRTPSIIQKLKINKKMSLSRMQDVGGLRVVLEDLENVYNLRNLIKTSEIQPAFKYTFVNEKDYIKEPKESGYRSLHLIYKYDKNLEATKTCRVEIQIRTKLHHAWATAVEVVGAYLRQPLKQSFGNDNLLTTFKKISEAFILMEQGKKDEDLFREVKESVNSSKMVDILQSFSVVTDDVTKNKKGQYFLIILNFKEKTLRIERYGNPDLDEANKRYSLLEKKHLNDKNTEIVLVSVSDIKNLRKLYPNYFLDTKDFLSYLNEIIKT